MPETLTVDQLADALQEPNRPLLRQVLRVLGTDRTATLLAETLQRDAAGGMLTRDGARRRTPGGWRVLPTRQGAAQPARPPAPLSLYGPTAPARAAQASVPGTTSGADLGRGVDHPCPAGDRPSRRSTHDESDRDRPPRPSRRPTDMGGVPDAGQTPMALAPRLTLGAGDPPP
jgi:hypothetical protein